MFPTPARPPTEATEATETLIVRWRANGSAAQRDAIIERHKVLVECLAAKFSRRGVPFDDLVQTGWVALIAALDHFDPARETRFKTYATHCIVGEIKHYFRDRTWGLKVPRALQEVALRLDATRERLAGRLSREPTMLEMAAAFDITEERLAEAMGLYHDYCPASLETPGSTSEEYNGLFLADLVGREDERICLQVENAPLHAAIAELAPRDQWILRRRYFEGDTQTQVGAALGLSQMQICRLERTSLKRLRTSMTR